MTHADGPPDGLLVGAGRPGRGDDSLGFPDVPSATLACVGDRYRVCGAGLMGHGIAQSLAAAGHLVLVYEPERPRAAAGVERIGGNLQRSVDKGRLTADERTTVMARIAIADDLRMAAAEADG